jgi:hypothetical protein
MAVYFVVDPWERARVRVCIISEASSNTGSNSRRAGQRSACEGYDANPRSAGVAHRPRARRKRAAILGLALTAIGSGAFAALAATPIAVTVAITVCVISALLSVRPAVGATRANELASWVALAASIAGLAFTVAVTHTGRHEPTGTPRPMPPRTSCRAPAVRLRLLLADPAHVLDGAVQMVGSDRVERRVEPGRRCPSSSATAAGATRLRPLICWLRRAL